MTIGASENSPHSYFYAAVTLQILKVILVYGTCLIICVDRKSCVSELSPSAGMCVALCMPYGNIGGHSVW